jgi:thioredoxin reductase (NADPH)
LNRQVPKIIEAVMLTVDEVSAVPLFSALPASNLERLARTSADIHLGPGEFAVHEGGEPALFAVLSGKIEVVKLIDGIERRLGWRVPGTIFGEVPIALGSPFPGGYRAVEPSRVMRVELQEYYTIAAASKDVSLKVSALARERLGGLQSINAEPHRPRVTLVGHRWYTDASAFAALSGAQSDLLPFVYTRRTGIAGALAGTIADRRPWSRRTPGGR